MHACCTRLLRLCHRSANKGTGESYHNAHNQNATAQFVPKLALPRDRGNHARRRDLGRTSSNTDVQPGYNAGKNAVPDNHTDSPSPYPFPHSTMPHTVTDLHSTVPN